MEIAEGYFKKGLIKSVSLTGKNADICVLHLMGVVSKQQDPDWPINK